LSSKISVRLGVPALLFFLIIGMLISNWEVGVVLFLKDLNIAQSIGIITLVLVLFLGGLETEFNHVRPILKSSIVLSTLGVLTTAMVVGCFLHWATSGYLSFTESLLLGTIVSSTDAAAVFSILGARDLQLKTHLGPLLESESGSNDVIVYSLLIFLIKRITLPTTSLYMIIPYFFQEMFIGAVGGVILGYGMVFVINKIHLTYPGLYLVLVISMIFGGYALVNSLHGSGFLAMYVGAIMLNSKGFIYKKRIIETLKGISWLMQIVMFITFGLLMMPSEFIIIIPLGVQLALVLMLIARPLSVFLLLIRSSFKLKHKLFISWVGLRGAVPIIFATYLYVLPIEKASMMFHLIFFIVLVSIMIQGTTLYPLVQWLGLEQPGSKKLSQVLETSDAVKKMLIELVVPSGSIAHEKPIVELNFPKNALIALIYRNKRYLTAHGKTIIKAHDKLLIMMDAKKDLRPIKESLGLISSKDGK